MNKLTLLGNDWLRYYSQLLLATSQVKSYTTKARSKHKRHAAKPIRSTALPSLWRSSALRGPTKEMCLIGSCSLLGSTPTVSNRDLSSCLVLEVACHLKTVVVLVFEEHDHLAVLHISHVGGIRHHLSNCAHNHPLQSQVIYDAVRSCFCLSFDCRCDFYGFLCDTCLACLGDLGCLCGDGDSCGESQEQVEGIWNERILSRN